MSYIIKATLKETKEESYFNRWHQDRFLHREVATEYPSFMKANNIKFSLQEYNNIYYLEVIKVEETKK